MMTASFKYVIETDKVALDISIGISDAVTYSCLGCEINNHGNVIFSEDLLDGGFVGDRIFNESPVSVECRDFGQTFFLDIYIIVIGHGVYTDYLYILHIEEKTLYEIAAYKAGGTCYKNSLALKVYIML